jgi:hypothetical protein
MVGLSLPLALLNAWEEYRERWSEKGGKRGREECIAVAAALRSRIELLPKGRQQAQMTQRGCGRPHRDSSAVERIQRGFAGTHQSSAVLGVP